MTDLNVREALRGTIPEVECARRYRGNADASCLRAKRQGKRRHYGLVSLSPDDATPILVARRDIVI